MKVRQIASVSIYNFRHWHKNPRIIITFCLTFILCFLLSDKAVSFAKEYGATMQIVEAFVWTFGDSNSILISSLLLLLLFADMPFISNGTPFFLMRTNRKTWLTGQAVYIVAATSIYLLFVLTATSLCSISRSFVGNMWSETAAILGYSGAGKAVALPALIKTLEMSAPYECMWTIFLLMLLYALLMAFVMLFFNIYRGQLAGVVSAFAFSLFGFLLNPQTIMLLFQIPEQLMYKANVAVVWNSPLNHATYNMLNVGYDRLPRLWQTYVIFAVLIALFFFGTLRAVKKYSFNFTGTEGLS
jgi:hypothetical protein